MHQVTSRHTQSLTRRSTDVSSQTNVHGLWEEPDKLIRTHKDSSTEARPNFSNSIQNVNLYRGFWFWVLVPKDGNYLGKTNVLYTQ